MFADEETLAASVGVRGQDDPPIGLMSVAKFRDLEDKNYAMKICEVSPWVGYAYPKSVVMASSSTNSCSVEENRVCVSMRVIHGWRRNQVR